MEQIIILTTYEGEFEVNRYKLVKYLKEEHGISLEEFLSSYTWDEAEYIKTILVSK